MPIERNSATECCVGFRLELAGGGDEGQERQVHEDRLARSRSLESWRIASKNGKALDIAHCAADLDEDEIIILVAGDQRIP